MHKPYFRLLFFCSSLSLIGAALLELIVYTGVIQAKLQLPVNPITYAGTLMMMIALFLHPKKIIGLSQTNVRRLFWFAVSIWLSTFFLYISLRGLDVVVHQNYVLSTWGVHVNSLPNLLFALTVPILLLVRIVYPVANDLIPSKPFAKLVFAGIIALVLQQSINAASIAVTKNWFSLSIISKSKSERMIQSLSGREIGGWIVPLTDMINTFTPESSVIFTPPQTSYWRITGNGAYMRYFIYPRRTIVRTDIQANIPPEATHVLISYGLWPTGSGDRGWPKIDIPAEHIDSYLEIQRPSGIIIDRTGDDYVYDPAVEQWGLIELNKL